MGQIIFLFLITQIRANLNVAQEARTEYFKVVGGALVHVEEVLGKGSKVFGPKGPMGSKAQGALILLNLKKGKRKKKSGEQA